MACLTDPPCVPEREACTERANVKLGDRAQPGQPHLLANLHAHSGLGGSGLFLLGLQAGWALGEAWPLSRERRN